MENGLNLSRLLSLCETWEKAGCNTYERDPLYAALVIQLRSCIEAKDFDLISSASQMLKAETVYAINKLVQDLAEIEIEHDILDPLPRIRELFAIPINIHINAPDGTYVLGKPVGPNLMLRAQDILIELIGENAKVMLAPAFYTKVDINDDYPVTAVRLRHDLVRSFKQGSPKMLLPAAAPMEIGPLRKKFLRFLVGVAEHDFHGRLLRERRFDPDRITRYRSKLEEELVSVFQRMGPNMHATVGTPNQFHLALEGSVIFPPAAN